MSDQSGYAERQNEWVKNAGVEIGDSVLITTRIDDWSITAFWVDEMDATLGQVGSVTDIVGSVGVQVACKDFVRISDTDGWWYPFFVLAKVEDKNDENPANTD